ncbi:MAG: gliding motility-associated C-terminal domain-containing protein [Chryseobacterium sp.]|jgi:gliding motility-associated-like protein|uniref:T9SS type B sorting domain-containing protein n=1 Tax=Chryseobacterium sp. TaxID=1871047 RepID=UPI00283260E1|nr:gliding motility-associated C-terminal domain-containing protein [Chryseobacterium sp.]MDR2236234.1 gliding motility-associated C-terminal domain-containing protein [Chryseobacterium sp.]
MKKKLFLLFLFLSTLYYAQSDCETAVPICGDSDVNFVPTGWGDIQENIGSNSCLSTENFSVWYKFTVTRSGTLAFTISPNNPANDYDFALWGPTNGGCASLLNSQGQYITPLRCNFSGLTGITGQTGLSLTIPPTGTNQGQWSPYVNATVGDTYYLVVDNWSRVAQGFTLQWTGTASLEAGFNDPTLAPNPFIPPGTPAANPANPNEIYLCTGFTVPFDFTSLTAGIRNGNSTLFEVTYHSSAVDVLTGANPLTTALVNATTTYYYRITYRDPNNTNPNAAVCSRSGTFKFVDRSINATDATLTQCNNNNAGTAMYDLSTANVFADPTATRQYYPTLADMNAGTNEITGPAIYQYVSGETTIFVKVTSALGCTDTAEINLRFHPVVTVMEARLSNCFHEDNPSLATFDLTIANVTTMTGITKRYYPSPTDAVNGTNEILTPANYVAPSGVVFVKVFNQQGCYAIAKVNLHVLPPVKSSVLEDKIICIEDTTTLDAGPGFAGYEWSTGATTQMISNVGVGTYWVRLRTGECITLQKVKVYASDQPVVTDISVTNNSITINVIGGTPEYSYSMDNINWQPSNVFTNLSRGDHKIYVKDAYDCDPIGISVLIPNLINVITPNGDGVNDEIDYSALSGRQNLVFTVYDRYGSKIYETGKANGYKWDGTLVGKKIATGTYWYSITWNENDKKNTALKYSGWIMVKNRD